jgi:betaine-aldehyde dehydrogenase
MTALELAAIADAVGLPRGVLNIVNGLGPATGSPLANHSGVDKLAFTGSVATGSRIMEAATKAIKKISLELGGKSPIIVCKDADIDQAVDWVMVGIFFNQGQVCSATSRLLVHEDVKDQFLQRLKAETEAITISDGFATGSQLGPVVSEGQYKKILGYIRSGVEEGAKVLTGGCQFIGSNRHICASNQKMQEAVLCPTCRASFCSQPSLLM